jgi:hypothetical protein
LNTQTVGQTGGASSFQKLYEIDLDGQVYAQPLVLSNVLFPNGTVGDILVAATMNDTLSAFLVDDGLPSTKSFAPMPLWTQTVGNSVPSNFMPMAGTADTCLFFGNLCMPNGNYDTPDAPAALPPIGSCCPPNFNINPAIGILSTPVVLVSRDSTGAFITGGAVYAVAAVDSGGGNEEHHLFSVDLLTGRLINSVVISGSIPGTSPDSVGGSLTFDANHQMQRPGLLADPQKNLLFVAFGSHQDTRPFHGWVFMFSVNVQGALQPAPSGIWASTPNALGGAIWQAGSGLTEDDSNGSVYAMTGNGENNTEGQSNTDQSFNSSANNFSESFVALDPSRSPVAVSAFFTPTDATYRDENDVDLGSSGPVKIPGEDILLGADKEGLLFVLNTFSPPGLAVRQIFQASKPQDGFNAMGAGFHHVHGTPVIWRNSKGVLTLYVWPERDFLRAFSWDDQGLFFYCVDSQSQLIECGAGSGSVTSPVGISSIEAPDCSCCIGCSKMPGGIISISANGSLAGSGIVWASMPTDTDALYRVVPGVLRAFDAENLNVELWDSNMNSGRDGGFNFAKYVPPVVTNGRVYLATSGNNNGAAGSINVYGVGLNGSIWTGATQCNAAGGCSCQPPGATCQPITCKPGYVLSGVSCVPQGSNPR